MDTAETPVAEATFARCRRAAAVFRAGKIDEALSEMRRLADDGCAPAQVFLGWVYELGRDAPSDTDAAMRLYRAAARSDYRIGQYYFGMFLYRRGDVPGAVEWIR